MKGGVIFHHLLFCFLCHLLHIFHILIRIRFKHYQCVKEISNPAPTYGLPSNWAARLGCGLVSVCSNNVLMMWNGKFFMSIYVWHAIDKTPFGLSAFSHSSRQPYPGEGMNIRMKYGMLSFSSESMTTAHRQRILIRFWYLGWIT